MKSLAGQTAKATEEISAQIEQIQRVTKDAVGAIKMIGGTLSHVGEIAAAIASAITEQGAATQEIARNISQAATRTSEVNAGIRRANQNADQNGRDAINVREAIEALANKSAELRSTVASFAAEARSRAA